MYIYFHGAIFDPAQIVSAYADEDALRIEFREEHARLMLPVYDEDESVHMIGELYQAMLETGIAYQAPEESELSEETVDALQRLKDAGYEWLAEDADGKVYAFRHKPDREGGYWTDRRANDAMRITDPDLLSFECDEEPVNIIYLILN